MGLGIARHLSAAGRRVALLDLDGDAVTAAAADLGRERRVGVGAHRST